MIEWANLIAEILPEHYQQILIEKDLEKGLFLWARAYDD